MASVVIKLRNRINLMFLYYTKLSIKNYTHDYIFSIMSTFNFSFLTNFFKRFFVFLPLLQNPVATAFSGLWIILQPALFGLIGAEINLSEIDLTQIGHGLLILAGGLLVNICWHLIQSCLTCEFVKLRLVTCKLILKWPPALIHFIKCLFTFIKIQIPLSKNKDSKDPGNRKIPQASLLQWSKKNSRLKY